MKLDYRPEIDGLRALAVGVVILYHAQITILGYELFRGGYIGVDIFFVISGYLITKIILNELITTKNFSFKYFYERRARRILPALLFVMLASLPFAWFFLLPSSLVDFSKSIISAIGFSSNYYFHYSGQEYGAEKGLFLPFLHTWSLSVEEQYYILFPIILLFIFKYFRNYLIYFLITSFLISLGLAEIGSKTYPSSNFYFLHSRMWELLAGSILSYYEIKLKNRSNYKKFNIFFSAIGLFLIFYSIIYFNEKTPHPSINTLLPVLGVCLILWYSNKHNYITRILSAKLIVAIGLISYSLYLWHYPIFAFYRYSFASGDLSTKFFLIFLLFGLSIFSYYFIEKKFRNKNLNLSKLSVYLTSIIFILVFISLVLILNKGFPKKAIISNVSIDRQNYINSISEWYKNFKINKLSQKENNLKKIIIFGDSHAKNFELIFQTNRNLFKNYEFLSIGRVTILLDYLTNKPLDEEIKSNIQDSDVILFSYYYDNDEFNRVKNAIKLLKSKTNKKIILTSNNTTYPLYGSRYTGLDMFLIKNKRLPNNEELLRLEKKYFTYTNKNDDYNFFNKKLNKISLEFNIKLLDKSEYQCNKQNKTCLVLTKNGKKINYDSDHHTLEGASFLGKKIFDLKWLNLN
ncbi:acyltransferase [Candidatus Pelagibacter sp.]|nr:acyltransferase [Candidatus Pelagibacter sp.]